MPHLKRKNARTACTRNLFGKEASQLISMDNQCVTVVTFIKGPDVHQVRRLFTYG